MKLVTPWLLVLLLQAVPQTPKASIEGVVMRSGTGEPIAGAQVTLSLLPGADVRRISPVLTDRAGKFSINNLTAGSYKLAVVSNGYVRQEFGQRHPAAPGAPIVLTEGQALKDIPVRLIQAGNVSGHVRNARGRPLPGITLRLARPTYDSTGTRSIQSVASTQSDDRGEYRFYWMTPGRYYVVAGSPAYGRNWHEGAVDNELVGRYLYTFFPGSTDADKAVALDVKPGGEVDGVDFTLGAAQQYRIRARFVDSNGKAPPNGSVSIFSRDLFSSGDGTGWQPNEAGTFDFGGLTPGVYDVRMWDAPTPPMEREGASPGAEARVTITNADVDLGVLTLQPTHAIAVRITGELPPPNTPSQNAIRILFSRREADSAPVRHQVNPSLDRDFTAYFPYASLRVSLLGLPSGIYLSAARLDGADALNDFALVSSPSALEIVLSSQAGEIDGIIRDEQGRPAAGVQAVLVPDVARGRSELFKETISDQNGHFSISTIPPGDYKLFAWEGLEPYAYFDTELLRKYEQKGRRVHIAESSRETLELMAIPAGAE